MTKNPIELWDELTTRGKIFSWWIMPVYYITSLLLIVIGAVFYGVYSAWQSHKDD